MMGKYSNIKGSESKSNEPQPRKKLGFNKTFYANITSVRNIDDLEPVLSLNEKAHRKIESESDKDSEDEWKNADFFESSIFWRHEQEMRKGTISMKDAKKIKKKRKN